MISPSGECSEPQLLVQRNGSADVVLMVGLWSPAACVPLGLQPHSAAFGRGTTCTDPEPSLYCNWTGCEGLGLGHNLTAPRPDPMVQLSLNSEVDQSSAGWRQHTRGKSTGTQSCQLSVEKQGGRLQRLCQSIHPTPPEECGSDRCQAEEGFQGVGRKGPGEGVGKARVLGLVEGGGREMSLPLLHHCDISRV